MRVSVGSNPTAIHQNDNGREKVGNGVTVTNTASVSQQDVIDSLTEQLAKANERVKELEKDVLEEIENRDNREEWLDKLSDEISRYLGVDIGEHSSANNPWREALDSIPEGTLNKFAIENQIKALESCIADNAMDNNEIDALIIYVDDVRADIEQLRKEQSKC